MKKVALTGQRRRILRLHRRAFHIAEGKRATVRLRVSRRAFRIVKQKGHLRLRVRARARDAAGNVGRARRRVMLLAPAQRH